METGISSLILRAHTYTVTLEDSLFEFVITLAVLYTSSLFNHTDNFSLPVLPTILPIDSHSQGS